MPAPKLVLQIGHANEIYALSYAPDGHTLAAGGSERTIRIWDANTGELRRLLAHGEMCRALAWSPDGTLLAAAGEGVVALWEPRAGMRQAMLTGHCGQVSSVAFSPDGKLLACASEGHWFGHEVMWVKGGEVQIWDVAARKLRASLGKSRTEKRALAWSPDGNLLAVASSDNAVRLWDLATGQPRRSVLRHKELGAVAFSPDGLALATGGADGTKLWDLQTMKPRQTLRADETASVAFSPAGDRLAVGNRSSLLLYDPKTGRREAVLEKAPSDSGVSTVAFSPDGRTVARGSNRFLGPGQIKLWDVGTKKLTRLIPGAMPDEISAVAFSPVGSSLFTAGGVFEHSGGVTQWDAETGAFKQVLVRHHDDISRLTLAANGSLLAAPVGAKLLCWDPRTGGKKRPLPASATDVFALSPDGSLIATVDEDAGIRLLDVEMAKVRRTFRRQANVLAFAPDGRTIAAGSDRGLSLWDIDATEPKWQTSKLRIDVEQLAFSADSTFVAAHAIQWKGTKGRDEVRVWNTAGGDQVHVIAVDDWPSSVVFSPDGSLLAVAAQFDVDAPAGKEALPGSAIQLWDTASWRLRHRMVCHTEEVKNLTFSTDGRVLAASHADYTATLWDPKRGARVHLLEDAAGEVTCLAFSPDGKKLATGNHDGWISFWDVSTGRLLVTLQVLPAEKPAAGGTEWIAFTPAGYYTASRGATKFIRWREGDRLLPAKAHAGRLRRPDLVAKALRLR
jgi:WD40 repeat protein